MDQILPLHLDIVAMHAESEFESEMLEVLDDQDDEEEFGRFASETLSDDSIFF
jgi:hypothetical protein